MEEKISSIRSAIGASSSGRSSEVVGEACVRASEVRRWKKAVVEAMKERVRRQNIGAEHDLERRRYDGLLD